MCTLGHVLNEAGLAAVPIVLVRPQAEAIAPPRALYCDFPLGRPLGTPGDPAAQRRVLDAAFSLLERTDGPFIADYPEVITDEADTPLACPLPPRHDPDAHPAVDEVGGLLPAWRRTVAANGATQVGRVVAPDGVADAVARLATVADDGAHWQSVSWPGDDLGATLMDIRAYYEEAAVALAGHVPGARQTDAWFYRSTETGALLQRFAEVVEHQDPPLPGASFLLPAYLREAPS